MNRIFLLFVFVLFFPFFLNADEKIHVIIAVDDGGRISGLFLNDGRATH